MTTLTSTAVTSRDDRLPLAALLALAMTGFICIVTETLPAGLLPQMAAGVGISASLGGQTVAAYALGSLLAAIPLTIFTQGWRRRNVLSLAKVLPGCGHWLPEECTGPLNEAVVDFLDAP